MSEDTAVTRQLNQRGLLFHPHSFEWVKGGGTAHSSRILGVDEYCVIKTLIMEDEAGRPLCILMHGDCRVNTKLLAKKCGVRKISPCAVSRAEFLTGYKVGGTSPFAMHTAMPVYAEESIFDLDEIFINGGGRGFLVSIHPEVLTKVFAVKKVRVSSKS